MAGFILQKCERIDTVEQTDDTVEFRVCSVNREMARLRPKRQAFDTSDRFGEICDNWLESTFLA
jgi:hypothetical protein